MREQSPILISKTRLSSMPQLSWWLGDGCLKLGEDLDFLINPSQELIFLRTTKRQAMMKTQLGFQNYRLSHQRLQSCGCRKYVQTYERLIKDDKKLVLQDKTSRPMMNRTVTKTIGQ
mmetsp:Transcript_23142/g.75300  ORF Transcript_23142/g.75300 Transcript_23142/m.75300 type:complete len:117 (+) Transcript_23142:3392-3742(+)